MRAQTNHQRVWWLMALISCMVVLGMNVGVQASQLNKDLFVDSITVSHPEAFVSESVELKVTFSEKNGHKFKPGDQMIFDLPSELEGFVDNLDLEDYATVRVEHGRAIVTFNDLVAIKENIKGTLSFYADVRKGLADNSEKNLQINLGTHVHNVPTLKVKGHKTNQPNPRPKDTYKGGKVDVNNPEILTWYVVVNANALKISGNVVVTDELGPGHVYVPGSFTFSGNSNVPVPRVKLMANKHFGDKFQIVLPEEYISEHGIQINYQTRLTGPGKKMNRLTNKVFTQFQPVQNNPENVGGEFSLANLLVKGNIEGDDQIKHETEETLDPVEEGTVDEISPLYPQQGTEGDVENHLEDGIKGTDLEVHTDVTEETLPDETVDPIDPIEPEEAPGDVVEEETIDPINPTPEANMIDTVPNEMPAPKSEEKPKVEPELNGGSDETVLNHDVESLPAPLPNDEEKEMRLPAPKNEQKLVDDLVVVKETDNQSSTVEIPEKKPKTVREEKKPTDVNTLVEMKTRQLPKTGSVDNLALTVLGLLGLVFSGLIMIRREK